MPMIDLRDHGGRFAGGKKSSENLFDDDFSLFDERIIALTGNEKELISSEEINSNLTILKDVIFNGSEIHYKKMVTNQEVTRISSIPSSISSTSAVSGTKTIEIQEISVRQGEYSNLYLYPTLLPNLEKADVLGHSDVTSNEIAVDYGLEEIKSDQYGSILLGVVWNGYVNSEKKLNSRWQTGIRFVATSAKMKSFLDPNDASHVYVVISGHNRYSGNITYTTAVLKIDRNDGTLKKHFLFSNTEELGGSIYENYELKFILIPETKTIVLQGPRWKESKVLSMESLSSILTINSSSFPFTNPNEITSEHLISTGEGKVSFINGKNLITFEPKVAYPFSNATPSHRMIKLENECIVGYNDSSIVFFRNGVNESEFEVNPSEGKVFFEPDIQFFSKYITLIQVSSDNKVKKVFMVKK